MLSLLMIFAVLCFTTFSILSLVSARADGRLTGKAVDAAAQYYLADRIAQEKLAEIDAILQEGGTQALREVSGMVLSGDTAAFSVPLEDGRELQISLRLDPQEKQYEVIRYCLENTEDWTPEDSMQLWDGSTQEE